MVTSRARSRRGIYCGRCHAEQQPLVEAERHQASTTIRAGIGAPVGVTGAHCICRGEALTCWGYAASAQARVAIWDARSLVLDGGEVVAQSESWIIQIHQQHIPNRVGGLACRCGAQCDRVDVPIRDRPGPPAGSRGHSGVETGGSGRRRTGGPTGEGSGGGRGRRRLEDPRKWVGPGMGRVYHSRPPVKGPRASPRAGSPLRAAGLPHHLPAQNTSAGQGMSTAIPR